MTTLIAIYLAVGFITYWVSAYFLLNADVFIKCKWHHWFMALTLWCVTWPFWNLINAWYWWRAKK